MSKAEDRLLLQDLLSDPVRNAEWGSGSTIARPKRCLQSYTGQTLATKGQEETGSRQTREMDDF